MTRTNNNSNKYYTFTYMEEDGVTGEVGGREEVGRLGQTFSPLGKSPVKIYIET